MSVLIKGIAMPKSCWDCELFFCSLKDRLKHIEDRNPDCPLVEIPAPHGRLIDADNLCERILKTMNKNIPDGKLIDNYGLSLAQGFILGSSTILEAEE